MTAPQNFVGLISGTSVDGIDACVARFDASGKLVDMPAFATYPYSQVLQERLLALGQGSSKPSLQEVAQLDHQVGAAFADAAVAIVKQAGLNASDITAVGSHGQTLFHGPDDATRNSLQIGDANLVAARLGVPTVADFRRADMAVGGHGAPLAPALHAALWRADQDRAIVNLGGIANVTLLPGDSTRAVLAFDTGPANALLDAWADRHLGQAYDAGGQWAATGTAIDGLLARLMAEPYFSQRPPKSTGRETFNLAWLERHLAEFSSLAAEDIQATLVALTTYSVADAIKANLPECGEVFVCGGGAFNPVLMAALARELSGATCGTTENLGMAPDAVEAVAFAWLAMQRMRRQPGNLPSVTGAQRAVMLGAVYEA